MGTDAPQTLSGARVTIMGLGRFGGGIGVTQFLAAQGADILLTDLDPPEKLAASIAQIQPLIDRGSVSLRLGEHNVSDFTNTDLIVANPAVPKPWDNRFLRAAAAAGVPITTEIRLLFERLPNREHIIGITGSAGKSTTTSMIAHALRALIQRASGVSEGTSSVHLGGNIGGSLLSDLPNIHANDWVVLELSSAMLYWLSNEAIGATRSNSNSLVPPTGLPVGAAFSPHLAVVTNVSPNHLDWHAEFSHYERSKQHILRHQPAGAAAILHESLRPWADDAGLRLADKRLEWVADADAELAGTIALPGRHNRLNAVTAARALVMLGFDESAALSAIRSYAGLAHRLQFVGEFALPPGRASSEGAGGIGNRRPSFRAYNDSKSTTPESAALAIAALDEEPTLGAARVHLIAGGYDKKIDLGLMCDAASRCAHVYTIGVTGPTIAAQVNRAGGRAHDCKTLERAIETAADFLKAGDAILLSPGCASWDQFTHFEERGESFISALERRFGRI
ncbi:MAG TPA: UDP-N-acetylmuramoyl-L-alanine--D-glutamate ligase [Phycisphaerales bacterium]|nr:UDP-N-acetylmuramoyl-L-alanine--D-glutamate ligase [Phycisphaerales bacterium]